MSDNLLAQGFVYLAAAAIGVPVAKRLGFGSVLGYLAAGVLIGPFALQLVGSEGADVMHFAEFGVVMMLFLVGLELKPSMLWRLRRSILGLGGIQMAATTAIVYGIAQAFGLPWTESLAIGLIVALSSTAIVLQTLSEKGLSSTAGGRAAFSVLLFQDIAVIPILALFPLLGSGGAGASDAQLEGAEASIAMAGLPGGIRTLVILAVVLAIVAAGRYLIRPLFRWIALTRLREAFTATALTLVVGIALLMEWLGVSAALGTFLAGVVLADSEYRHELEADIEPFKGLLLGVFFVSVGAQIDFALAASAPLTVGGLVLGIIALKALVLYVLGRGARIDVGARWLFTLALAQVGEFAFVLLGYATANDLLSETMHGLLMLTAALSMALTPLLFILLDRVILPRIAKRGASRAPDPDIEDGGNPVIIAGFGRFGQIVGRLLSANGIGATVLDLDPAMVELLGRVGFKVYYGDATRPELLSAAGVESASVLVIAIDDVEACTTLAREVRAGYPHVKIIARARDRTHHMDLMAEGVDSVYRETLGSALECGTAVLRALGFRAHTAARRALLWRRFDEGSLNEFSKVRKDATRDEIVAVAKQAVADVETLLTRDHQRTIGHRDEGWDGAPRPPDQS